MRIREAREQALRAKADAMSGREVMNAFFYIANKADVRRMADVLGQEKVAEAIKKLDDKLQLKAD